MPSLITIVKPSCQYRTRGCSFSRLEARAFTSRRLGCNTNHSIEVLISLPETAASAQHTQRRCSHFEKRNNALTETFREHAYVCLLRTTAIAMMKTGSRFSTDMLKLSAQTGAQRSQPCVQKQQRAHCVRQVWSFSQSLLLLLLLFVSHLLTFALGLTSPSSWACFPAVVSMPSAAINKHCNPMQQYTLV